MAKKIMIIDDEAPVLDSLKAVLEDLGYAVEGYSDPRAGERAAASGDHDLILCNLRMPARSGADLVATILGGRPEARIVLISTEANDELAERALSAGALGLMTKPFEIAKLLEFLGDAARPS